MDIIEIKYCLAEINKYYKEVTRIMGDIDLCIADIKHYMEMISTNYDRLYIEVNKNDGEQKIE